MPSPLGFDSRDKDGPVGALARWWYRRRAAAIRAELARRRPSASGGRHRLETSRRR